MNHTFKKAPKLNVRGCEIIIFQSLRGATFLKNINLLGQNSKSGAKGTKMIRMASGIDLAQLVFCVAVGCPNNHFCP